MSNVQAGIIWDGKNQAWFTANATEVFDANITIFCNEAPNYGQYKFTDGVTQLSALPWMAGSGISITTPNAILLSDNSNDLDYIALGANQSIRRNSANTAYEAFTPIVIRDVASVTHTGTTVNTIVSSYLITANTIITGDFLRLYASFVKTTILAGFTIRFYVNTSVSLVGATLIKTASIGGEARAYLHLEGVFAVKGAVTEAYPPASSLFVVGGLIGNNLQDIAIDWSVNQYFIVAIALTNGSDSIYQSTILLKKD
jgi:hypothetical protein